MSGVHDVALVSLRFHIPVEYWTDEEVEQVATTLSAIACELLKGEHRHATQIVISNATGRPVAL
jgi:hypothetical protein